MKKRFVLLVFLLTSQLYGKVGLYEGDLHRRGYRIKITRWALHIYGDKTELKKMIDVYFDKAFPNFHKDEAVMTSYQYCYETVDKYGYTSFSFYGDKKASHAALEYAGIYDIVEERD